MTVIERILNHMIDYFALARGLIACLSATADAKHCRYIEDFVHGEMRILAYLAEDGDGASPGDICENLAMTTPRISSAVASLEKKKLVIRETDERDKRRLHVYITEEGKALVDYKKNELTSALAHLFAELGEDDAREYVRIMGRIGEIAKKC